MKGIGKSGKKNRPLENFWKVKYPGIKYDPKEVDNLRLGIVMSVAIQENAEGGIGKLSPEWKWFRHGAMAAKQALMTSPLEGLLKHEILYGPRLYAKQLEAAFYELTEIYRKAFDPILLKKFQRGEGKKFLELFKKEACKGIRKVRKEQTINA